MPIKNQILETDDLDHELRAGDICEPTSAQVAGLVVNVRFPPQLTT